MDDMYVCILIFLFISFMWYLVFVFKLIVIVCGSMRNFCFIDFL